MRNTRLTFADFGKSRIWLGRQGENLATRVEIDVAVPAAQYPECTWALNVRPPRSSAYPATFTIADNVITWDITASDTAQCGAGAAELVLTGADGEIVKSAVASTGVSKSLAASVGDAPEPLEDWLAEATKRLGEPPTVNDDGHWAVWQDGEYVDTGVPATGKVKIDASLDGGTGRPMVAVEVGGTEIEREYTFHFYNLVGAPGQPGQDGYSPVVNLTRMDDGVQIDVHNGDGSVQTAMVYDGLSSGENSLVSETWTFTLSDGSTVSKAVYLNA